MQIHSISTWWQTLKSYFKGYPEWLVEFGLAAIIGLGFGFLMKNFGKYLLFIIGSVVAACYMLNYFSLATFHIAAIQKFFGITEIPAFESTVQLLVVWARSNIPICTGGIIGFLFGWGLGK